MEDINEEKYKNAILYFVKNMDKYELGTTKLAKLLYYLDFLSYRDKRESVTKADHYKQQYGPVPQDFFEIIKELREEEAINIQRKKLEDGRETDIYTIHEEPDEDVFNEEEIELMRNLIEKYKDWETDLLVAKSHSELPWRKAEWGTELDLDLADTLEDFDSSVQKEYQQEDKKLKEALQKI